MDPSRWPLEVITLADGQRLEGLLEKSGNDGIEFVEVRRPQSKPMFLLIRHFDKSKVISIERLPDPQRAELQRNISKFRTRTRFERGRLEDINLRAVDRGGVRNHLYDEGQWFTLQSTADEEMTRRCILRIEQIFEAYRRMLPPREHVQQSGPPGFLLFGTTDEYRSYLMSRGLTLENPAFFAVEDNLVVAGSNFSRFAQQLARARQRHEVLRKEQAALNSRFPEELAKLNAELRAQGMPSEERNRIRIAYLKSHEDQRDALELKIKSAERRNIAAFDEITARMFARLYHEAFHAYLENFLFPHQEYQTPRWLNEGVAQVFEGGVLDGDVLRIDAPERKRLEALQADLKGNNRLPLVSILTADERAFLVSHSQGRDSSTRHYLYSWGLAYYLMFQQQTLNTTSLERLVAAESTLTPVEEFEHLTGMKLADFEAAWRETMLNLRAE